MSLLDNVMDGMIKALPREKREEMMINMMPAMMEGIDINALMPRMISNMLNDVTADDIIGYIKEALRDRDRLAGLVDKILGANLMGRMMFRVDTSSLGFQQTLSALTESAVQNGWKIPDTRDLQVEYRSAGLEDMARCTVLYFCNPQGGYGIFNSKGENRALTAMMPMGVSVYETPDGQVEVAAINLTLMSYFFGGVVKEIFRESGERYVKSLEAVNGA